jgi:uncharacterized protein (TIGR02594 family)
MVAMLPKEFHYLYDEPGPRILKEMMKLYGTVEEQGPGDNPVILEWARSIGYGDVYKHDAIPWCGLTVAYAAQQAGWDIPVNPLWARNWLKFGYKSSPAMLGDILVFARGSSGHVAMYVGEDAKNFYILGGNQSDAVNIHSRLKSKDFLGSRRCPWRVNEPKNVRQVYLNGYTGYNTNQKET